jgi:hypothetical protein
MLNLHDVRCKKQRGQSVGQNVGLTLAGKAGRKHHIFTRAEVIGIQYLVILVIMPDDSVDVKIKIKFYELEQRVDS